MPFDSASAHPLRRNRTALVLGVLPLVLGAALMAGAALTTNAALPDAAAGGLGVLLISGGLLSTYVVWRSRPWPVARRGRLAADERGVLLDGALLVPWPEIEAGFLVPGRDGPPLVRIHRPWPRAPLDIVVSDEAEGGALLDALGLGPSQAAARLRLPSPARVHKESVLVYIAVAAGLMPGIPIAIELLGRSFAIAWTLVLLAIHVGWMVARNVSQKVTVGADGILITWLWRHRFIQHREVRALRRLGWGVETGSFRGRGIGLDLFSGETVVLPIQPQFTEAQCMVQCDQLMRRIQDAMRIPAPAAALEVEVAALDRGGRPLVEWVRALRALGTGAAADHRTAHVPPDRLLRIAEDPQLDPLVRAGAAIALSASPDAEGRPRLAASARVTASPRLRVVLELAAEGAEEEQLAEELAHLEGRAKPSRP